MDWIVFHRLLTCLLTVAVFCVVQSEIRILPKKAFVIMGDTMKMWCFVEDSSSGIQASDLWFSVNDEWNVTAQDTYVVNMTHIYIEVKIDERHFFLNTYKCRGKTDDISTMVYVERPLKNVTKSSAVYYVEDGSLNITWDKGNNYLKFERTIDVNIGWNSLLLPNVNASPCDKEGANFCYIENYPAANSVCVRVVMSYKKTFLSSDFVSTSHSPNHNTTFCIEPYKHIKLKEPTDVKVVNITSQCLWMEWKKSHYLVDGKQILLEATFTGVYFHHRSQVQNKTMDAVDHPDVLVEFCSLHPFTDYIIDLRIKPAQDGYWSKTTTLREKTLTDKPARGPPLRTTSFSQSSCENGIRNVKVFWNDVDEDDRNGILTSFRLVMANDSISIRSGMNYWDKDLNCQDEYLIEIFSSTSAGETEHPSTLLIPRQSEYLTLPESFDFKVEVSKVDEHTVVLNATWHDDGMDIDTTLVFYTCQETYPTGTCFDDFTYTDQSIPRGELFLSSVSKQDNLIGFALKNSTGHVHPLEWTQCVYERDNVPKAIALDVSKGKDNSFDLRWNAQRCSRETHTLISRYHIYVCEREQHPDKQCAHHIVEDGNVGKYSLQSLKNGQKYYIYIQAETVSGKLGPLSKPATEDTDDSYSDVGEIMAITSGVLVIVIFLGCMVFLFLKKQRKVRRKYKEMAKHPLELSKDFAQKDVSWNPRTTTRNDSVESGVGSMDDSTSNMAPSLPPTPSPPLPEQAPPQARISKFQAVCSMQAKEGNSQNTETINADVMPEASPEQLNTNTHVPNSDSSVPSYVGINQLLKTTTEQCNTNTAIPDINSSVSPYVGINQLSGTSSDLNGTSTDVPNTGSSVSPYVGINQLLGTSSDLNDTSTDVPNTGSSVSPYVGINQLSGTSSDLNGTSTDVPNTGSSVSPYVGINQLSGTSSDLNELSTDVPNTGSSVSPYVGINQLSGTSSDLNGTSTGVHNTGRSEPPFVGINEIFNNSPQRNSISAQVPNPRFYEPSSNYTVSFPPPVSIPSGVARPDLMAYVVIADSSNNDQSI